MPLEVFGGVTKRRRESPQGPAVRSQRERRPERRKRPPEDAGGASIHRAADEDAKSPVHRSYKEGLFRVSGHGAGSPPPAGCLT